ncbi:hypothetical protein BY458DRAFT_517941 [Sporodiniella umbellata]|nr:hypothetical protein BY458DRAFT_517941 [Sporodiniella umbellata]
MLCHFIDWVQKIPFGKKTDGLKIQNKSESYKIEVEEVISYDNDGYLKSIVSSKPAGPTASCTGETSTCDCYKCQRQRRRAGSPLPRRSNTVRKTPTLKSYEKHIPRPTYSQQDSIYRLDTPLVPKSPALPESRQKSRPTGSSKDNYEISWEDDRTGDDLLRPLVTFQSIFEATDQSEGLSELLEQRTKELQARRAKQKVSPVELPPRHPDCLTRSYRHGPPHSPLTLYHTMKMASSKERGDAYDCAFQHCVQSDSGLRRWLEKTKKPVPVKESKKTAIQPISRKTRRSILSSIRRSHRQEAAIFWPHSHVPVETPAEALETQPTDLLLAARALLPNQHETITIKFNHKPPYEHIDVPAKPKRPLDVSDSLS